MWEQILPALALVLIIEGILPFLSPGSWRQTMTQAARLPDQVLRVIGLVSMVVGVVVLYLVH